MSFSELKERLNPIAWRALSTKLEEVRNIARVDWSVILDLYGLPTQTPSCIRGGVVSLHENLIVGRSSVALTEYLLRSIHGVISASILKFETPGKERRIAGWVWYGTERFGVETVVYSWRCSGRELSCACTLQPKTPPCALFLYIDKVQGGEISHMHQAPPKAFLLPTRLAHDCIVAVDLGHATVKGYVWRLGFYALLFLRKIFSKESGPVAATVCWGLNPFELVGLKKSDLGNGDFWGRGFITGAQHVPGP